MIRELDKQTNEYFDSCMYINNNNLFNPLQGTYQKSPEVLLGVIT